MERRTFMGAAAAAAVALPMKAQAADIVDAAVSAGSFNTLVAAVQAAGLVDTLKGRCQNTRISWSPS